MGPRENLSAGCRKLQPLQRRAEAAFVVIDAWQGRGVGGLLTRHLIAIAREAGLTELTAEVLPENAAMLRVFDKFGFKPATIREPGVIHMALKLS
ncbi:GNAT family N-acetyltransferase [Bradyrhizobium japonicum]|uniref:GNAT family N-acetyltransferase n=1 Tax=Bradyrhizobium japonicum TaxID=375 RepID=UPI0009B60BC9|nr:GNAT family N-acetyltransferase [Bradyrhizobium japonicum]UQE03000.1 GNAT family N-acetyltransferase [Bradyrhizobium japonicum]